MARIPRKDEEQFHIAISALAVEIFVCEGQWQTSDNTHALIRCLHERVKNKLKHAIVNFMVLPSEHLDVLCFFTEVVTE